ncbi:hypothetical protein D9M71_732110 [compost metagenome]
MAAQIVRGCAEAGISNLVEALTSTGNLKDEASVKAAIRDAKAVRDLCVSARLPDLAAGFVKDGLGVEAVRARLFDKLVGNGFGEIINTLPTEDDLPSSGVKAVDPGAIYASRKPQASKGVQR